MDLEQQCTLLQTTLRSLALLLQSPDVVSDEGDPVFGPSDKIELGLGVLTGAVQVRIDPVISVSARPRFHFKLLRDREIVCDLGVSEI